MKHDPEFLRLNALFVDAHLRRWETHLEHAVHLRLGKLTDDEREEALAKLIESHREADKERDLLRQQAHAKGWSFPLDNLCQSYGLSKIERSILELALMPHLDLGFRRRIARFNNNIIHDFVDVALALALLFPDRIERLQARRYFGADAPLLHHRLISLEKPPTPRGAGALSQEIQVAERLADFALCRHNIDSSLRLFAHLSTPKHALDDVSIYPEDRKTLKAALEHFAYTDHHQAPEAKLAGPFLQARGLAIALVGPPGTGKSMLSQATAHELKRPIITIDSATLAGDRRPFVDLIDQIFTEARVQGAVLVFDRCESIVQKTSPRLPPLLSQLERHGGLVVFTTHLPDELDPTLEHYIGYQLNLGMPDSEQRSEIWRTHMPTDLPIHPDVDLDDLGTRFELNGGQIASACELATQRARASHPQAITQELLRDSAQSQIRADMTELSIRSRVTLKLSDLVLPERELEQIDEIITACRNRIFVMTKWGFGKRLVTGKGITVLFKGSPGTGKTLCAEIMASELGLQLYRVSIPNLVSKYVGETEKNISRIFAAARANHSMLLFDEADSLFGKRVTNVESSIDRFSNMETNLLLQEIERFEGVIVLTTNLDKNIDDAFARRIMFRVDFPKPDAEHRSLIWQKLIPKECPIDDDIDYETLGDSFELSGGNIKNAVVRAAYRAAERGDKVTWDDIEFAAENECINAGMVFRSPRQHFWP